MRYYELTITDPKSGQSSVFSSFPNGVYDPSALDIHFDAFIVNAFPASGATIIGLEGIELSYLSQPTIFNGFNIELKAGMLGGLPISASQPAPGMILMGTVFGTFGNWIGERILIEFVVTANSYSPDNPGNFTFYWPAGTSLANAIQNTLSLVFPNTPIEVNIGNYVWPHTETGAYSTASGLARLIYRITSKMTQTGYPVQIYITRTNGKIVVTDFTNAMKQQAIQLQYVDLIGQPTWLPSSENNAGVLSVPVILRSDIHVGDLIRMPKNDTGNPGAAISLPSINNSRFNLPLTFQGTFIVIGVRQTGQFRGTSGEDWMTVLECGTITPQMLAQANG